MSRDDRDRRGKMHPRGPRPSSSKPQGSRKPSPYARTPKPAPTPYKPSPYARAPKRDARSDGGHASKRDARSDGGYARPSKPAPRKPAPSRHQPPRRDEPRRDKPFPHEVKRQDRSRAPFAHKAKRSPGKPKPFEQPNPFTRDGRAPAQSKTERAASGKAARVARPQIRPMARVVTFPAPAPPRVGEWLLTTRPEAEQDLLDELVFAMPKDETALPRIAGPALVATPSMPGKPRVELAFARQGFPVSAIVALEDPRAPTKLAEALIDGLPIAQGRAARARGRQPFSLEAWVPDDDRTNPQSGQADTLAQTTMAAFRTMSPAWAEHHVVDARAAWVDNGLSAQICVAEGRAYFGVLPAREAPSLAPGGRLRVHVPQHAPSRSAAKLLEAFAWLDRAPEAGELCVDLGAAPGGWSWVLLERGAKVLAVDPGRLDPIVGKHRGLTHLRADAFRFEPEYPVDWLVADMAWRPLEAAALYGKWARRSWARLLIANIKLPMLKKAEYLMRVRDILGSSGWQGLRARQLYHDREEVTIAGVRL